MSTQESQVFAGILKRDSQWRRLGGSGLAVTLVYGALFAGMLMAGKHVVSAPRKKPVKNLVVTLFDAPKLAAPKLEDDTGGSAEGAAGDATVFTPAVKSGPKRTAPPTPAKAVASTEVKQQIPDKSALPTAASEDPKPTVAMVNPAPVADVNAPSPNQAVAAPGPSQAPGLVSGNGTGGAPGGMGGSGTGTSTGTGSGWKVGTASGDTVVLPFGDGMTLPSWVQPPEVEYTKEARDAEVRGLVMTECTVTTSGAVKDCKILKSVPLMDQAVLAALARAKFTPVIYQGKPQAVRYRIPIRLTLD